MNNITRDAMNGHFLWAMILCSLAAAIGVCSAQQEPGTTITGKIMDADNSAPLENAIVFLANTPRGTSSENDGTFRIASVPVGTYELIISRVGYERQSIHLQAANTESLYYVIKLHPQPVRTKEVEVLGERPAKAKPNQQLFFPKESPDTYCIYGTVSSLSIGVFFADSAFYMYSLDTAVVDSEKYIRLWLLYENLSQTTYDLDPMKCIRLHMRGKHHSYTEISPVPISLIRSVIDTQRILNRVSETIGKPLRATVVLRSKFEMEMKLFGAHATGAARSIRPLINTPSVEDATLLSPTLYNIFQRSVAVGLLKRYTVYPENSLNGCIFFPFPGLNWKATGTDFPEAWQYHYQIEIITRSGSKVIDFIPQ